eukprot:2779044-Pyramimonas_sp.AAC.1
MPGHWSTRPQRANGAGIRGENPWRLSPSYGWSYKQNAGISQPNHRAKHAGASETSTKQRERQNNARDA